VLLGSGELARSSKPQETLEQSTEQSLLLGSTDKGKDLSIN
jgi:hypothetical protein